MRLWMGIIIVGAAVSPALGQVVGGGGGVTVTSNPTISTLTTGVVLNVSPSVSADGRYVNMGIQPSFSSLDGLDEFRFNGGAKAGGVGDAGLSRFMTPVPFRPAVVGKVTFVEKDAKLLAAEVPAMTLKDVSLKDAGKKLAEVTKSNVVLGLRGLEQAGVDVKAARTFTIEKGTLKDALLAVLKVGAAETDMVISAEDSVVQVDTQAQADHAVVTRTYYLEDLLANLPRIVPADTDLGTLKPGGADSSAAKTPAAEAAKEGGQKDIPATGAGVLPPAGAGKPPASGAGVLPPAGAGAPPTQAAMTGKMVVAVGPQQPAAKPASSYSTSIEQIISSTVRPEIWKINGGKIGEIAVVGDRVTITAPESVQVLLDGPKHYNPNAVPMYVGYSSH